MNFGGDRTFEGGLKSLRQNRTRSGFARTGRMFGIEHSGVEPDMTTVAKSLAGGFPLSGVVGRAMTMDAVAPGGLGGTYAGSPVACAAALAVLDVVRDEDLLDAANRIGSVLRGELARMASRNDTVALSNIRRPGATIAVDIVATRGGNDPDAATAKRVTQATLAQGLVLLTCGIRRNTIRLLMPLVISDALLVEGLERLERASISAQA